MNLVNTLIFSVATGVFLIGLHQSMKNGFYSSYWLYMISIGLLLFYKMRKDKLSNKEEEKN